MSQMAENLLHW